ncbi:MAG: phosphatidylglycerophosphatase A [Acetobacteraceae bacterium]
MNLARLVASGLGCGFLPRAPGTWGSLAALAMGAALLALSPWALPAGVVAATAAGLWAIPRAGGAADPGWVVIDEVAGMWLTMAPLPHPQPLGLAVAFAVFRVLDITKPGPIGLMDRQHGAVGVMGDDLVAGAAGAVIIWALFA